MFNDFTEMFSLLIGDLEDVVSYIYCRFHNPNPTAGIIYKTSN
mgnify:CR=1 FL=1